jgi:hypothetical protein
MEGYCSTGQSPQWAVVPVEEEEVDRASWYNRVKKNQPDAQLILSIFR